MKKKILLFILVLINSLLGLKLEASTNLNEFNDEADIVAKIGSGKDSDLFSKNVKEISGNVSWNKSGDYQVFCSRDDGTYFVRNVYVRDNNSLINGIDILKDIGSLNFEIKNLRNIKFSYAYPISNEIYYAYYNCELENDYNVSYICKYQKDKVSKVTKIDCFAECKKICFIDDDVYVLSDVYEDDKTKIQLSKYNDNLELISINKFESNSNDESIDMFYKEDNLYIFLNTSSNTGIITRSESNKIVLILKVNIFNFLIEDYLCIGNNYDNELIKCNWDNPYFNILINIKGSKGAYYHSINKSYSGCFIISINKTLNVMFTKSLENECLNYEVCEFDSSSNLMVWKNTNKQITLKYGEYNKEKTLVINPYSKDISSIYACCLDGNYYIFINLDDKLSKLISVIGDKVLEKNITNINDTCSEIYVNNNEIFLRIGYIERRLYSYRNLKIVKKEVFDDKNSDIKIEELNVFLNNKKEETLHNNQVLSDKFGSHYTLRKCLTKNYTLLFKSKYSIPLEVNIRNNEIYDPGIIVTFNGNAKLNGKEIMSNHEITDIGKYQLEIYSDSNEIELINFEIREECACEMNENSISNVEINYMGYEEKQVEQVKYLLTENSDSYVESKIDDVVIIFIFVFMVAYLFILFVFKKMEKKL